MSISTTDVRPPDDGAGDRGPVTSAYAFGLELEVPATMQLLLPSRGTSGATGRTEIIDAGRGTIERRWREQGPCEQLVAKRFADGRPLMTIDYAPHVGYRVWAPGHGRHLVSPDGSTVLAAPRYSIGWEWQRLFFAQVLPLAAVLQGLEPLHASAVARGGHVVAFTAPSGTGKTSVAAHLVARGATLVSDDVLVVEPAASAPLAHPATGLIAVATNEFEQLPAEGRARLGTRIGGGGKLFMLGEPCNMPLPLRALFVLERHPGIAALRVSRLPTPDPRILLSSSFIGYVSDGRRLTGHLNTCATLAAQVAVYRVEIPPAASAAHVASVVEGEIDRIIAIHT